MQPYNQKYQLNDTYATFFKASIISKLALVAVSAAKVIVCTIGV
jgi:hypothetical protein